MPALVSLYHAVAHVSHVLHTLNMTIGIFLIRLESVLHYFNTLTLPRSLLGVLIFFGAANEFCSFLVALFRSLKKSISRV